MKRPEDMSQLAETNGAAAPADAKLREEIFRYSLEQASPAMKGHIQHLCSSWSTAPARSPDVWKD